MHPARRSLLWLNVIGDGALGVYYVNPGTNEDFVSEPPPEVPAVAGCEVLCGGTAEPFVRVDLVDYPDDPGCAAENDEDEQSPTPPCDDGVDYDGDGWADYLVAGVATLPARRPHRLANRRRARTGSTTNTALASISMAELR